MYGYDVKSLKDFCVTAADESVTLAAQLFVPGETLINIFPILAYIPAWVPGASSHKVAAEVKRLTDELVRFPIDWAKMRMVCQLDVFSAFLNRWPFERRKKGQLPHPLSPISLKKSIRSVHQYKRRGQLKILPILCTVVRIPCHSQPFDH